MSKTLRTFGSIRAVKATAVPQEATIATPATPVLTKNAALQCPPPPPETDPCPSLQTDTPLDDQPAYAFTVLKQFTVTGNALDVARVLGNLNESGIVLRALNYIALCPQKSELLLVPRAQDADALEALLHQSGVSYSVSEVLDVQSTGDTVQTALIDIIQRLYQNVDIINIYSTLRGADLIVQVDPRQLWNVKQILGTDRNQLGGLRCYKCPRLPSPNGPEICSGVALNCGPLYPCEGGCGKPCDENKNKKHGKNQNQRQGGQYKSSSKDNQANYSSDENVVTPYKQDHSDDECSQSEDECPNGECDYPETVDHGCGQCEKAGLLTCGCKKRPHQ